MSKIIVTDLTRFNRPIDVCTAGTDIDSGACIRPMPYLKMADCSRLCILPGAILRGDFVPKSGLVGPHQEDAEYSNLQFVGPCTPDDFKRALAAGMFESVEAGFEIKLAPGQKHVPIGHPLRRSIITLAVAPSSMTIVQDRFNADKVKIHFSDSTRRQFSFLPITDLGFHRYAASHNANRDLAAVNNFIRGQPEAYLRVGLSREYEIRGTNGYWMQVNGIYTFPDFLKEIRSYK